MEQVWGRQLRQELVLFQLLSSFRNAYAGGPRWPFRLGLVSNFHNCEECRVLHDPILFSLLAERTSILTSRHVKNSHGEDPFPRLLLRLERIVFEMTRYLVTTEALHVSLSPMPAAFRPNKICRDIGRHIRPHMCPDQSSISGHYPSRTLMRLEKPLRGI